MAKKKMIFMGASTEALAENDRCPASQADQDTVAIEESM